MFEFLWVPGFLYEFLWVPGFCMSSLLEQTRRHGAGNAPKSAGEDPPSGASFISHFRRREIGAQSAPEISDFPAPSCGLSGTVLGTFRRRRLPVCAD